MLSTRPRTEDARQGITTFYKRKNKPEIGIVIKVTSYSLEPIKNCIKIAAYPISVGMTFQPAFSLSRGKKLRKADSQASQYKKLFLFFEIHPG